MIIHFICRGNSFRSIIAEAYVNSLGMENSSALSSGTVAALDKAKNLPHYRMTLELLEQHGIREFAKADYGDQLTQSRLEKADITVCMNQRVYDECLQYVTFPGSPRIWSVADIGEPGRIAQTESERRRYREEAYREIIINVDRLISSIPETKLFDARRLKSGPPISSVASSLLFLEVAARGNGYRLQRRADAVELRGRYARPVQRRLGGKSGPWRRRRLGRRRPSPRRPSPSIPRRLTSRH
jgi:protein-tyrosine-phosphatase